MSYSQQFDLLDRKKILGWTNREIANIIGCTPGVASSKLNGFIILKEQERRKLVEAFSKAEQELVKE